MGARQWLLRALLLLGLASRLLGQRGGSAGSARRNVALVLNAGKYFYNYRMEANLMHVRGMLLETGFAPQDLLLVKGDNIVCNANAVACPSVRVKPNDEHFSILPGNYEVDYALRDNNPVKYLELLVGRYEPREANSRKLERDEATNFFFYSIGHGGDLYFKIQDTEVIFAQQVADYLKDPAQQLKYRESFLLSDSCAAGTLFSLSEGVRSTYMLGTSAWKQKSTSFDFDNIYTQPINDKFIHYYQELIFPDIQKHKQVSVATLKQKVDKTLLQSDLLTFNYLNKSESHTYLNDFVVQAERRETEVVRPFTQPVEALLAGFFPASQPSAN